MNLKTLSTRLESAKDDTNVQQVIFDYSDYLNTDPAKIYPVVLWDIANLDGIKNLTKGEALFEIDVFCIIEVKPEDDRGAARLEAWDDCEVDLQAYLDEVNDLDDISIPDLNEVEVEYFPAGFLSIDREVGVRYRITLKLWC